MVRDIKLLTGPDYGGYMRRRKMPGIGPYPMGPTKICSPGFNNCNSSKSRTASTLALVEKIFKTRQAMNV